MNKIHTQVFFSFNILRGIINQTYLILDGLNLETMK